MQRFHLSADLGADVNFSQGIQFAGGQHALLEIPFANYQRLVSLILVDVNYSDLYTGLIDVNLGDMQKRIS
ncbi:hypothetical protein Q6247_26450, partial [Klebsiella pneumoniae]